MEFCEGNSSMHKHNYVGLATNASCKLSIFLGKSMTEDILGLRSAAYSQLIDTKNV